MKVKFCGITRWEDYEQAIDVGAHFVGFIFHPKSPRYLNPEKQNKIVTQLVAMSSGDKVKQIKRIGVFVNEDFAKITKLVDRLLLDGIQIHGDEDMHYLNKLAEKLKAVEERLGKKIAIWKCVKLSANMRKGRLGEVTILEEIKSLCQSPTDWVLLEKQSNQSGEYGGTGKVIDEKALAFFLNNAPKEFKFVLAGGLDAANIEERINWWRKEGFGLPKVLDFNSGVEIAPGVKSHALMGEVMVQVRKLNLAGQQ